MVLGCDCCQQFQYQQIGESQSRFGVRHFQCFLVFCGLAVAYALRVNLSVAIVAMTDQNATNVDFPIFEWDESIKSYLLSSFFWGYVVTQVPGGYLAQTYGAKYTLFIGVILCSMLAILTPFVAEIGDWRLVLILRASQGLCQGVIFPSTHAFLSKWSPADERGRLVGFCYSGAQFGTVIMLSASGYIASSIGWPSIFYFSGAIGILWAAIFYYYCASTPAEHPTISLSERRHIEISGRVRRPSDAGRDDSTRATPWWKICTSTPFLTLILVHCANNWGFWTLLTEIPTYMKNILGMNIERNGPLSAVPYLAMCLLTYVFIFLADILNDRSVMPLWFSRKLFNTFGQWLPMVALMGLGYIDSADSFKLAIILLTIAVGTNAATYLGFQVNHIDLAPNFAGTMMGITNCAANIISIIAPLSVGLIVTNEEDPLQWRIVFYVSAAFYFVGNLLFIVFGRTSIQSWNYGDNETTPTIAPITEEVVHADETEPLFNENDS